MSVRRSFATLALAPSSRLRAPKISRPLATLSSAPNGKSRPTTTTTTNTTTTRQRRPSSATPRPAAHSAHKADHRAASPSRQQSSPPPWPSSSRGKRPLLRPYELSQRLIELCKRGAVDIAVTTLQQAPQNAQNIKVWNTIIQQCMDAKKFKLAYTVFTDMKRRGFVPNIRTYATMMGGYSTVDNWGDLTKQLSSVDSVYEQLKEHIEKSRNLVDDPAGDSGASFILYPVALYISVLGKAGKYQRAFDVFHGLDTDGPLAPHPKIYSSLLCALAERVQFADVDPEIIEQSVSEAKYVWRRHMRSLDKQPQHHIEPRSVDAMIKILSCGKPADHELMFDILRDICGLPRLDDDPPSSQEEKKVVVVPPTKWILKATIEGCIAADRPDLVVHYAQSVMNNRELRPILHARDLYRLIRAHLALLGKEEEGPVSLSRSQNVLAWVEWMVAQDHHQSDYTLPNEFTLTSAFELCYRCQDTPSALRVARVMLAHMHGGGVGSGNSLSVRLWEYLFHLAATVATADEKRQCLELLDTHRSVLAVWESTSAFKQLELWEKKVHTLLARHIVKVLRTVLSSPDNEGAEGTDAAELKAWSDIGRRAESLLEKTKTKEGFYG